MVRSIECLVTVHSYKELDCRSFLEILEREREKKSKKNLEHWVGNWEQQDWSPLGGWIPYVRIVLLGDESARGDQSKELRSCACPR